MLEPMTFDDRERLGRYELLGELGRGAMGVVYLAQDPLIGRQVALKVFRVGFSASEDELRGLYARFIREAQSAGILSHPGIVTVHDVAQADGKAPAFIAMEYVEGRTLKEILDSPEPIPRDRAVDYVLQIAAALEYAHSMGVVHRDIKPGNVLITSDHRVKITDFGIALVNAANNTNHGQLLGTPNYMAPEAIEEEELDGRADLFSLGVVLYELLTRHKPFAGRNMTQVTHRIVYEPFTPVEKWVRDLPEDLLATIHRALEKKPERRFQSAAEMATALEQGRGEETFLHDTAQIAAAQIAAVPPLASSPADTQSVEVELAESRPRPFSRLRALLTQATPVANLPLWLLVGGIIVGVGVGWLLSRTDRTTPTPVAAAPTEAAVVFDPLAERVRQLERTARRHLSSRDSESAYYALAEAVRLRPDSERLVAQFEQVETELVARRSAWQQDVDEQLAAARRSLADGRIRDSAQYANLALQIDPMNLEAPDLIERGRQERARIEARRRATPEPMAIEPHVVEQPAPESPVVVEPELEEEPEPEIVATTGTLTVRLETALSPGVLTVYRGDQQIYRSKFRFAEKKGRFRSLIAKAGAGSQEETLELPPGALSLRVYVSVKKADTQTFRVREQLERGDSRTLLVTIDETGTARTALQ